MPDPSPPRRDAGRERDANIIAHVVALIHARRAGDYLTAASSHEELRRLGVLIRFPNAKSQQEVANG